MKTFLFIFSEFLIIHVFTEDEIQLHGKSSVLSKTYSSDLMMLTPMLQEIRTPGLRL